MGVRVFSYVSDLFSLSDEQAMLRVQEKRDSHAFALLVRRWQGRIQRLCTRLLGDSHRAEDLTQEVFMRLFAHRNDYQHQGRFATYVTRIAVNACYDERRRLKRHGQCLLTPNNNGDICASRAEASPEAIAAGRERAEIVRGALLSLPQRYQQVVVLRHYEGLKFREIANVLNIPQGTVKSRMAEALTRLGRSLEPILNEQPITRQSQRSDRKEVL